MSPLYLVAVADCAIYQVHSFHVLHNPDKPNLKIIATQSLEK